MDEVTLSNYIGVKLLKAKSMTRLVYNTYRGWKMPNDENPDDDGYLVVYPDGYESWSPKPQFEEAYREMYLGSMNFGLAVEAMKKGLFVSRHGWNGKDMFIYFVKKSIVDIENLRGACAKAVEASGNTAPVQDICGHIDMKAADGSIVVGWLASQTDILADDYFVVK